MKLGGESNKSVSNIWESFQNYKQALRSMVLILSRFI